MTPNDEQILAALNDIRIMMKNRDRSEYEQKLYDVLRMIIEKFESNK